MNFLELVKKRQSIRHYLPKKVDRGIIDKCVEAARLAPSACNSQPWKFIIVDNPEKKDELADAAFSGIYSLCTFVKKAPVIVVVITEKSSYAARVGAFLKNIQYSLIDIGIACEHFVLQAAEEGVGTCMIGWFSEKKVKKVLNLPKSAKIDMLISMGYPENEEIREKIRKPIEEVRRFI